MSHLKRPNPHTLDGFTVVMMLALWSRCRRARPSIPRTDLLRLQAYGRIQAHILTLTTMAERANAWAILCEDLQAGLPIDWSTRTLSRIPHRIPRATLAYTL